MDTTVASVAPPHGGMTETRLCVWLGMAAPGDQLVYHTGFLAIDCDPSNARLTERQRTELRRVARRAMLATGSGLAHLVQRRNGPGDFTYLIVARPRPMTEERPPQAVLAGEAVASQSRSNIA